MGSMGAGLGMGGVGGVGVGMGGVGGVGGVGMGMGGMGVGGMGMGMNMGMGMGMGMGAPRNTVMTNMNMFSGSTPGTNASQSNFAGAGGMGGMDPHVRVLVFPPNPRLQNCSSPR